MIKLATILRESNTWKRTPPSPLLGNYILSERTQEFSGWLYHGTPYTGLYHMLTEGIYGTEHGEVAEYDTFSTSLNSEVLRLFSEGCGETGLQFSVEHINVVVLNDMLLYLVTQQVGSGFDAPIEDELKFKEFCEKFRVPVERGEYYLPYNYLSSLGVDAFTFEYVWRRWQNRHSENNHGNDEAEICFIGRGIEKLNKMISEIYIDGQSYDDKNLAIESLKGQEDD